MKWIVNWKLLGLDPSKVKLTAPEIVNFQPAGNFRIDEEIPVEPTKGWLILVSE